MPTSPLSRPLGQGAKCAIFDGQIEYGAKIAALERKIGQLTMELDVMKKRALIRPSQQGARPSIISGPGASPSDGDVAS